MHVHIVSCSENNLKCQLPSPICIKIESKLYIYRCKIMFYVNLFYLYSVLKIKFMLQIYFLLVLTLLVPFKIAADDILIFFFLRN